MPRLSYGGYRRAQRRGQLAHEQVALDFGLRGAFEVVHRAGVFDVLVDVGETSPVRFLGSGVEDFAGAVRCDREIWIRSPPCGRVASALRCDQIEDMKLAIGGRQQPREVPHPLEVAHEGRLAVEYDRPVVAVPTEYAMGTVDR